MNDDIFKKYYKRVARRGWVKSIVIGLIIAFAVMFVSSVFLLIFAEDLFYIAFILFGVCAAVAIPLLYFLKYKPDTKEVANAVDALGMEERFVTMLELDGSRSYIAQRQRSDTYLASQSVPATAIRIAISTLLLVLLIVIGALGLGMTTYTVLVYADVAPGFNEIVEALSDDNATYYDVIYDEYPDELYGNYVVGDGLINGARIQRVKEGDDCTTVYAEAMDGSVFVCWTDGVMTPQRTDINIQEDMTVYAVFLELSDGAGDGEGDGSGNGESEGDSSDKGEGEGEEQDGDSDNSGTTNRPTDSQGNGSGASGGYDIDYSWGNGQMDYRDDIGAATDDAEADLNGSGASQKDKDVAGGYFDALN